MSDSKASFQNALRDVENLMRFHQERGGVAPGRRPAELASLNKSGIVLLCSAWEVYVESVVQECADKNVAAAATAGNMLKSIRKLISNHIREGKDESAWLGAAGEGWRDLAKQVVYQKVSALNTPKWGPISELMKVTLGVNDIEATWFWHRNPIGEPARRLNEFVALRGAIAHGEQLIYSVNKVHVTKAEDLIRRLVDKIDERLEQEGLL